MTLRKDFKWIGERKEETMAGIEETRTPDLCHIKVPFNGDGLTFTGPRRPSALSGTLRNC